MNKEFLNRIEEEFSQKDAKERADIIVDQYFHLSEARQNRGKDLPPARVRKILREWLHTSGDCPEQDTAVLRALLKAASQSGVPVKPLEKSSYSLGEVSAMYGLNPWTIRMWINRFGILRSRLNREGDVVIGSEDVERIGAICHLTRIGGLSIEDVRQRLESGENTNMEAEKDVR